MIVAGMIPARISGYFCSLPERLVRAVCAVAGGAVQEVGEVALPARVRRSRLYVSMVESTARFLSEQVGQVESTYPKGESLPDDFLMRRTAGNLVEIAGLATFSASPVWVLAALSDIAGAGRDLIGEIAAALQDEGLLERNRSFENVEQLLDGLEATTARMAEAVNTPPLDIPTLRKEWERFRGEASRIPHAMSFSVDRLWSQWAEMKQEAAAQNRSVVELSSVMAMSAARNLPENVRWLSNAARAGSRRTGEVLARGLLDHYRATLAEIRQTGYLSFWLREFRPYLAGAVRQFSPRRISATERFIGRRRQKKD